MAARRWIAVGVAATCAAVAGCSGSGDIAAPTSTLAPSATPSPSAPSHELTGTLTVSSVDLPERAALDGCSLVGREDAAGFSDITAGAQVTVTDQTGTIVGTSSLGVGRFVPTHTVEEHDYSGIPDAPEPPPYDENADLDEFGAQMDAYNVAWDAWMKQMDAAPLVNAQYGVCEFPFSVADLPSTDFLSVEVTHRGPVTYSFADLTERAWTVALDL